MNMRNKYPQLYNSWNGAKQRCRNVRGKDYDRYGGRGIKFCDEWTYFKPFVDWALSSGWEPGLTIDRIDPNGDYEPSNCRWTTVKEQNNNRRSNHYLTVEGETHSCRYWSDIIKIPHTTISYWISRYGEDVATEKVSRAFSSGYVGKKHAKGMKIYCVTNDTEYSSLREAAKHLCLERTKLSKCIRNNTTCNGYKFVTRDY